MGQDEFDKILEKLKNRKKKLKILNKEDSIKYVVNKRDKKITLVGYNYIDKDTIVIPDFITDIEEQIQTFVNNQYNLVIKIGNNVSSLKGLLRRYHGKVVTIVGGQDKLTDLSELANDCWIELLSIELDKSVRPIKMNMQFSRQRIGQIRFNGLDMSRLTQASYMFNGTIIEGTLDLQDIRAESLSDLQCTFYNQMITEVKMFKTLAENVNLSKCFLNQGAERVQFSKTEYTKVLKCTQAFDGCQMLKTVDLGNLDFSQVESTDSMFRECRKLIDIKGDPKFSNVFESTEMFKECTNLEFLDLKHLGFQRLKYISQMFKGCSHLYKIKINDNQSTIIDASNIFSYCVRLKEIECDTPLIIDGQAQSMFVCTQVIDIINTSKFISDKSKISNTRELVSLTKAREISLGFDIVVDKDGNQFRTISRCLELEKINFMGKVIIGKRANQTFIADNPRLKEINFYGGLYINCDTVFNFISKCDNLSILRQSNELNINKMISSLISSQHTVSQISSYKQGGLYIYEISYI